MSITKAEIEQLSDEDLMRALAVYGGIRTESQLDALFEAINKDMRQAMLTYGFAHPRGDDLVLTESGVICAEVIMRFSPKKGRS